MIDYTQYPYTQAYALSAPSYMDGQQRPGAQNTSGQVSLTWTWIQGGEDEARNYYVKPNNVVALWDSNTQVIYLKSTDSSGKPTLQILDYTIRETAPKPNYVTKEEFNSLSNSFNEFLKEYKEAKK